MNKQPVLNQMKQFLYCLKDDHNGESLDYICVERECKESTPLCCYICKHQKQHELSSLKIILYKLLDSDTISEESMKKSAQLDLKVDTIEKKLRKYQKQFVIAAQIFNAFEVFEKDIKEKAMKPFLLTEQLLKISKISSEQFQKELSNFITKNYNTLFIGENGQKGSQPNLHESNLDALLDILEGIIVSIQKMENSNKIQDYDILGLFPLAQDTSHFHKVYFSDEYHGTCMSVSSNRAQMTTSGSQRVLAMENNLQKTPKVKKWKIHIVKLASWIGVGVCHINKLKNDNWNFNYSSTGHGSYFISSNGYSWSSYKPEFNSKFQPFTFKTDDVITLQFNPRDRMLKISKEETDQSYSLEIQSNGDPIHPAINLTGLGDCVEIV